MAGLRTRDLGNEHGMAVRIALALVAAIRAALIYGDGAELCVRPVELPRWRVRRSPLEPVGQALEVR